MGNSLGRETLAAVIEAYTPEGVVAWLVGWVSADTDRDRTRRELGVIQEWSGEFPGPKRGSVRPDE